MKKLDFQYVKNFCSSAGITVLSKEYKNNSTKLELLCENGHTYIADFDHIKRGHRCSICRGCAKHTLDYVRMFCLERGFIVHDSVYINNETKLNLTCKNGHNFKAVFSSIRRGSGCPHCNGNAKSSIEKYIELAKINNGTCISKEYRSARSKLEILCHRCNRIFLITPNNMNNGKWCPNCVSSYGERLCRVAMQTIFGGDFKKTRPDWLKNPLTNYPLELDGFNESLRIGFEHQGSYHYRIVDKYKMTEKDLESINGRDEIKKELCEKNDVKLLILKEVPNKTKTEDLEEVIISQCRENGIMVPDRWEEINYKEARFMD